MIGAPIPTKYDGIPYIDDMPSFTMSDTTRWERVKGGWITAGRKCYVNMLLKLNFNWQHADPSYADIYNVWNSRLTGMPAPKDRYAQVQAEYGEYHDADIFLPLSFGMAFIRKDGSNNQITLFLSSAADMDGTTKTIRCRVRGSYDIA